MKKYITKLVPVFAVATIMALVTALPVMYYFESPVGLFVALLFGGLFVSSMIITY